VINSVVLDARPAVRLGLRENVAQFTLLVIVNAFVGAMVERLKGLVVDDALKAGTQIGPVVDQAIGVFISQKLRPKKNSAFDTRYVVGELPARGHQTGFSGTETIRLPFSTKLRGQDDPIAEGIVTLQLSRTSGAPAARALKITAGLPSDRFADDTRLAKADAELNAVYNALSRQLDEQSRETLRNEQRRWLEKRDKKTIDAKIGGVENPRIVRDAILRQLTEERTADLRARLKAKR